MSVALPPPPQCCVKLLLTLQAITINIGKKGRKWCFNNYVRYCITRHSYLKHFAHSENSASNVFGSPFSSMFSETALNIAGHYY